MKHAELGVFAVSILLLAVSASGSETTGLPPVIERGLAAFQTKGGRAAVENWVRGGPLENTDGEKAEVAAIQKLEKLYGRYQGFSVIAQIPLSAASRLLYLEVQLLEGPVYFKFLVFAGKKGVDVVGLELDPVPDQILPPYVLESKAVRPSVGR